jgi:hypothetical protein
MPSWQSIVVLLLGTAMLLTAVFITYKSAFTDKSAVPKELATKLTFSPLVIPNGVKDYTTSDYKFDKAEDDVQILSYIIHLADGNSITVSEYPQPPQFNEIPEYKNKFLTNVAHQYDTVETSNGTIYLGRQTKQNNKQLGLMLEKGLIIFMSPQNEIDSAKWHSLGEQLEIQKINND